MIQVRALGDFPSNCYIKQFFGKTYGEAIAGANLGGKFSHYYQQEFGKNNNRQAKSILVAYQVVSHEDNS